MRGLVITHSRSAGKGTKERTNSFAECWFKLVRLERRETIRERETNSDDRIKFTSLRARLVKVADRQLPPSQQQQQRWWWRWVGTAGATY